MAVTDYTTACGDLAASLIQMLASLIRGYHDNEGVLHYRLNASGASGECTELSDFLDCNTSHIEPERQLVENVFALDDCLLLTLKLFSNGSTGVTDYSECGEMPQTLIQMLARCIVKYNNANWLNVTSTGDDCTTATALLTCSVNDIEAERMLVENLFAVDSCGRLLLKLFVDSNNYTDYNTACVEQPQSLLQLLAQCIVLYNGHYYLNIIDVEGYCNNLHAFWTCSNNHIDPERALVENIFATDSCGNLALKVFGDAGLRGGGEQ